MFPATCPKAVCGHSFDSDRSGVVACPSCGDTVVIRVGSVATVDPDAGSTIDSPTGLGTAIALPALPMIGRFALRGKLGEGAFGEVFRAYDGQLDREVALKVAKPSALSSEERIQRFLREAKAAANLRHPNIVPLFDAGQADGRYFIASAFVPGRTLEAEIDEAEKKPLALDRAASVIRRLAEALGYAHKQGITHRDVKPANTLIDESGEAHLLDFGLAARAGDDVLQTQDGKVLGTPAYMSPEQAAGRSSEATAASDQYALGVMLFEMATGRRPFSGPMEVMLFNHIQVVPPRPRTVNPSLPRDLETIILKCLEKEPAKRYPTCEALAEDLRKFGSGEPVTARRISPVERTARWAKRNPVVAGSLAFAMLALTVGMGVAVWKADEARESAKNEAAQKTIAEGKTDEANKEAARADAEADKVRIELKESQRRLDLSRLKEAQSYFESNLVQLARDTLNEIAPENRCVAWGILNRRFEGSLFALWGHTEEVTSVAVSVDGRRIVTGSFDQTARVWDAQSGASLLELKGHTGSVRAAKWSR